MPGNGRGHDKHLLQLVTLPSPRPPFTPCATDFSAMVSHAFGSKRAPSADDKTQGDLEFK